MDKVGKCRAQGTDLGSDEHSSHAGKGRNRLVSVPAVDPSRCTGCGWCVAACPLHLLSLQVKGWKKSAVITEFETCTGCKKCELKCLFTAITMVNRVPGIDVSV